MAGSGKTDILLLGSGGREHALLAKLAESPQAGRLWVAPSPVSTVSVLWGSVPRLPSWRA